MSFTSVIDFKGILLVFYSCHTTMYIQLLFLTMLSPCHYIKTWRLLLVLLLGHLV